LRWAMGGVQALFKYFPQLFSWHTRRMWIIYFEFVASLMWAYSMLIAILISVLSLIVSMPDYLHVLPILPGWTGVVIGTTCMLQITVSMFLDHKYDVGLWKIYFWMIWYPLIYWTINMFTIVVALPKVLYRDKKKSAVWVSPDRGIKEK